MRRLQLSDLTWFLPVILITLVVYLLPVLHSGFVSIDDGALITDNAAVHEITFASLKYTFTHYDPELYIPLTFLSYQVEYAAAGLAPWLFHLDNLLLHIANALLVMVLARYFTRSKLAALCAGLFFAIHPLNTEAVLWASARKDLLSTFFFLLSLTAFFHSKDHRASRLWLGISLGCFVLALMAKVSIVVLPAIFLLIDWYDNTLTKKRIISYWPFALVAIFFCVIAVFGKTNTFAHSTPWMIFLLAGKSTVFYLQKILLPLQLTILYPQTTPVTLASPEFFVPLLLLIALIIATVFLAHRCKQLAFGLIFFAIALSPDLLHFSKNGFVFFASDRYAYVGMIGMAIACAQLLAWLARCANAAAEKALMITCVLLFTIYGFLTHAQAKTWQSSKSLYAQAISVQPTAWLPHMNNGTLLMDAGNNQAALAEFLTADKLAPHTPIILANIGIGYNAVGQIEKAKAAFAQSIAAIEPGPIADPERLAAYYLLGELLVAQHDDTGALNAYKAAVARGPNVAEAHYNLGIQYEQRSRLPEAIAEYSTAVTLDPHFPDARFHLASLLAQKGDILKAFSQLVKLKDEYSGYPGLQEEYDQVRAAMEGNKE